MSKVTKRSNLLFLEHHTLWASVAMCLRPRTVYTVCSHTNELGQEDCTQVQIMKAAHRLGGFLLPRWMRSSCGPTWARPVCATRVDYRLRYDFCPSCRASFMVHGELTETTVLNYWAYKNSHAMRRPVDPRFIPLGRLFSPTLATRIHPRDLRLEMVTLSEALHIWDRTSEFFRSQAYVNSGEPLNLAEYMEDIRSLTLHTARRADHSNSATIYRTDIKAYDSTKGTTQSVDAAAARVLFPRKFPEHSCGPASPVAYVANPPMVYEKAGMEEGNSRFRLRSPKGKGKAIDSPPPGEYQSPESADSMDQEYGAARQASIKHFLGSRYLGDAGPSKPYQLADSQPSDSDSLDQIHSCPRDDGVNSREGKVLAGTTLMIPSKSPSGDIDDVDSQASSPLVSPLSDDFNHGLNHMSMEHPSTEIPFQQSPVCHGRSQDSARPDSEILPDILSRVTNYDPGRLFTSPRGSEGSRRFDRPDSEVLPATYVPAPGNPGGTLPVFTAEGGAEIDFDTSLPNLPSEEPVLNASNDDLPSDLAQNLADIDTLFTHQFRPPYAAESQYVLPSSSYQPSPPLSPPVIDSNLVFYNRHNPSNPFQSTRVASPPLTAGRIAAVAAHSFLPSPLIRTAFAHLQPRAPARTGSPSLTKTPSGEIQTMYRAAIRDGSAVLSAAAPGSAAPVDEFERVNRRRRRSAVGLIVPATPKMEALEEATCGIEGVPRSAPPFPSGRRRSFEELAVTAVCFCLETGRTRCECPTVVEPGVWV